MRYRGIATLTLFLLFTQNAITPLAFAATRGAPPRAGPRAEDAQTPSRLAAIEKAVEERVGRSAYPASRS